MRVAALDLGTNTFRLIIADVEGSEKRILAKEQIITRLGGGYDPKSNRLSDEAIARALDALSKFAKSINQYKPERVWATATEIVRRASNGNGFRELAKSRTGIEIDVIAPGREAALAFSGICAYIPSNIVSPFVTLDIGGGSTEWVAGDSSGKLVSWVSLPLGVVELAEKVITGDPPSKESLNLAERQVREVVAGIPLKLNLKPPVEVVVGTGGTATSLAVLDMGLDEYDVERVQNHRIPAGRLEELERRLALATFKERADMFPLTGGREDVIIPGAIITRVTLEILGGVELLVSDAGLLEGILMATTQQNMMKDLRLKI